MSTFVPFEDVVPVRIIAPDGTAFGGRALGIQGDAVRVGFPGPPGVRFARSGACIEAPHRGYRLHADDLPKLRHRTADDARCWAVFDTAEPRQRVYRYQLGRDWGAPGDLPLVFVLFNPSVAGDEGDPGDGKGSGADDPTIRKCKGFAVRAAYRRIVVVNLFAFIATDPAALLKAPDPVGPLNDRHLFEAVAHAGAVVVAWGQLATRYAALRRRAPLVLTRLRALVNHLPPKIPGPRPRCAV